jgi:hypothetical protein
LLKSVEKERERERESESEKESKIIPGMQFKGVVME